MSINEMIKENKFPKFGLLPIYLDPKIIDITRLIVRFGSIKKRFENVNEMDNWLKKARKLNPGIKI